MNPAITSTNGKPKQLSINALQKHLVGAIVGAGLTAIVTVVAFYYNTNHTLSLHTTQIKQLDDKVTKIDEKVQTITVKPIQIEEQVVSLEKQVREIKDNQASLSTRMDKMNERMDKIYELLVQIKNQK